MTLIDKETIRAEIERQRQSIEGLFTEGDNSFYDGQDDAYNYILAFLAFLDSIQEQPVADHHEIEVEFRGEKVTVNREFYRKEDKNYSTSEQDDNVIWAALRAWCEKKGITAFELYPERPKQPMEGLEEAAERYNEMMSWAWEAPNYPHKAAFIAGAEWMKSKMMEKAVGTEVVAGKDGDKWLVTYVGDYESMLKVCKTGDKVKVIVIPEEK